MKNKLLIHNLILNFYFYKSRSFRFSVYLLLSWLYAICSQIIIPLPFNFVPISLQPLPLFLLSLLIGRSAVYAYFLCLLQTMFGAPFFSGFQGGIVKLLGPTGGYIIGWAFAMIFLVVVRNYKKNSFFIIIAKLLFANLIMYFCGLLQLSFYVPNSKLLILGLVPFFWGDLLKIFLISLFISKLNKQ